ncbi:MAG: glycosyltransferase family 2 protein, partial [Planctomycetes bacterium]|nr:glycosyltransferase family 2 protein [Planctomycetota bacterium]
MVTQNQIMIILATYNRAPILKRTLDAFCTLECDNLNVEFVVIDNNSTDNTKQLIESFASKLPITYLFEPRPGKNCALNKALTQLELAPIIVFTDDDVIPDKNWLAVIASACSQWPQYSIFGGRIYAIWPGGIVPNWAADKQILELGFACHDHGDSAKEYKAGSFPFGPNFWVRKKVFANGILFDETIGPMPKGRTMGSETSLLKKISEDGLKMLYYPDARVG